MDIRKFAFVVLDETDSIVDRFNLDYVTDISGLGYSLSVSTIDTDIESYITKILQNKESVSFKIIHTKGYSSYNQLVTWLGKHMDSNIALEYYDTTQILYCDGIVTLCDKSELDNNHVLNNKITFKPLTPFFKIINNKIEIRIASVGKSYPFKYPYSYGKNLMENNEIENNYFKNIPVIVIIKGSISNPDVQLIDDNGNSYNEVKFSNLSLSAGQRIIINSARKRIWFDNGDGNLVDYYSQIDPSKDSYLRADPLITSKLSINLESTDTGSLVGSYRQYKL